MKNASISIVVFILLILTSCSGSSINSSTSFIEESSVTVESFPVEIYRETYFAITQEDHFAYSYQIYNSEGKIVKEDSTGSRIPEIVMLSEKIVDISIGYGTGLILHCYYNAETNMFSDTFSYVIANSNQLIAYIDIPASSTLENRRIVIQNIFERNIYYQEIYLDFARVDTPVINAEFAQDGSEIIITYLKGADQIETTETFHIGNG